MKRLKWKTHKTSKTEVKQKKPISVLSKANHILDKKALHTLYCSLDLPYLNDCLDNWKSNEKCSL